VTFERVAATATGTLAVVATCVALAWWAAPSLESRAEGLVLVGGFFAAFFGMMALIGTVGRFRRSQSQELSTDPRSIFRILPRWFISGVAAIVLVTVVSIVASLVGTGGYSQNPAHFISRCPWSIGTNHGLTNVCVSHTRWLATGDAFGRAFLGMATVFLTVQCVVFTNITRRSQGN
jgi:hypothetical protein